MSNGDNVDAKQVKKLQQVRAHAAASTRDQNCCTGLYVTLLKGKVRGIRTTNDGRCGG